MIIAKIIAAVVSSHKSKKLVGKTLFVAQPIDSRGNPYGQEVIAVDGVGSGVGDIVLLMSEGGSARIITRVSTNAPLDTAVCAIVDHIRCSDHGIEQC
jgi:microcompartment protein CcmK/EutM